MVDRSGEVHDIRTRNRGLKILLAVLIVLVILAGIAAALYFFVFAPEGVHLEFEPDLDKNALIWVNQTDPTTGEKYAKRIDEFLNEYRIPPTGDRVTCDESYIKPEGHHDTPCAIDVSKLTECSNTNGRYGYVDARTGRTTPCVIVKMNKIYEWEPEPYLASDEEEAAKHGMPDNLIQYIKVLNQSHLDRTKRLLNTTWITCEGLNAADKENMGQVGYYYPGFNNSTNIFGGIPNMNFPYLEQDAYLSPFIFVKFLNPKPNVSVSVKCQAWAKTIGAGQGTVIFDLLID